LRGYVDRLLIINGVSRAWTFWCPVTFAVMLLTSKWHRKLRAIWTTNWNPCHSILEVLTSSANEQQYNDYSTLIFTHLIRGFSWNGHLSGFPKHSALG